MTIRTVLLSGSSCVVITAGLALGGSAWAQTAPAASSAAPTSGQPDLSEVVVHARRTSEKLLDTPISEAVFTSALIQKKEITSLDDIATYTPGLNITHSFGSRGDRAIAVYSIRGLTPGSSATASVFIDGAPVPGGLVEGIYDAAEVEVLKGPQSTAFGRSVFAGALSITTKTPSDHYHASFDVEAGSYNDTDDRFSIEGPIIPGKLTGRISARYYSRDGQYTNSANTNERLGDQSTTSVNGELYFTPTEKLKVKLFGIYSSQDDGPSAVATFVRQDYNCDPGGPATYHGLNYVCGTLKAGSYNYARLAQNDTITPLFKSTVLSGAAGTANPIFSDNLGLDHGGLTHKIFHTGLTIDYELPHNILFSSLTSYTDDRYSLIHDYDNQNSDTDPNPYYGVLPNAPPTYNWLFNTQSKNYDYSQEFRLRGDFGPLKAMVGASYTYNYVQYDNAALSPYGPGDFVNGDPQKTETYGLFFSGAYTFLRQWTINFEGRYQDDKVIQDKRAAHNGPVSFVSSGTFDNFVPRVTLQYKPTPLTQVYATYSEGVNPGTFNGSFISSYTPAQLAYINAHYPGVGYQVQPEKLTNYELGAKGEFLERTLQLNGSVYYNEWTNQIVYQNLIIPLNCGGAVCSTTSAGFYTNIGKTTLYGVEFEGSYKVSQHLTLDASASYNESNIDSFQSATAQSLTGNPTVKNKRLPQYSPYSANIGGEYRAPFLADLEYYARVDYVYKSGQYDSVINLTKTEASNVVNVRLGLSRPTQNLEFFATNLFNDKTFQGIESNSDLLDPGFGAAVNAQLPVLRVVGVRFHQSF